MNSSAQSLSFARRIVASIVTALAVAFVAYVATVLAYFISYDFGAGALGRINIYFLPAATIVFIVLLVLAALGAFSRWYLAVFAGLVAAVVGAVLGTIVSVLQAGNALTGEWLAVVLSTLGGSNLIFVLAVVVVAVTLGLKVWSLVARGEGRGSRAQRKIALIRLPASNLAEGEVTHIERIPIDADLADEQWDNYVDALVENGWQIIEVDAAPELPDSVFVEDTMVVFGNLAVIASPGAESRLAEIADAERAARDLGLTIARIEQPGTLDGGDLLKIGTTVYVGSGGRTNAAGISQLRAIVRSRGLTVIAVPITKVLHLKSAVTALPDGTVIGFAPFVESPGIFPHFLEVPEATGAHVVVLDDETVLMAASAPKSAALVESLGYRVVSVDISEFEKLEGCVTCLSVRIR